jgi:hypothetical protein
MADISLTDEQKEQIRILYRENPDLTFIVQKLYTNDKLDARSREGRVIRNFLVDAGLKYRTQKTVETDEIDFNDQQKDFIINNASQMTSFNIARVLFPNENIISPLSKEVRAVIKFLRKNDPSKITKSESGIGVTYSSPKNIMEAVSKINQSTYLNIVFNKLKGQEKKNVEAYLRFINSPRFIQIINSYKDLEDRSLFESEFTRFTWDKPDLTSDEITLYINVCQDLVNNKRLLAHVEKLNQMFESTSEGELTIRLAESMKAKASEYDQVQKRIESIIKKLNGDRSERLKKIQSNTANILALVEAFQQEEERKRMLVLAKAQREKVKLEADRLESVDELKARILGISKYEVL